MWKTRNLFVIISTENISRSCVNSCNFFIIVQQQAVVPRCRLYVKHHVSFNSQQQHFVVVTFHSADVANPPPLPLETGISSATFGIQKREESVSQCKSLTDYLSLFNPASPFLSLCLVGLWFISQSVLYTEMSKHHQYERVCRGLSVFGF